MVNVKLNPYTVRRLLANKKRQYSSRSIVMAGPGSCNDFFSNCCDCCTPDCPACCPGEEDPATLTVTFTGPRCLFPSGTGTATCTLIACGQWEGPLAVTEPFSCGSLRVIISNWGGPDPNCSLRLIITSTVAAGGGSPCLDLLNIPYTCPLSTASGVWFFVWHPGENQCGCCGGFTGGSYTITA